MLYRIVSEHFCAGIDTVDNKAGVEIVIDTAPILGYTKGWTIAKVYEYCKKKKWEINPLEPSSPTSKPTD